MTAAREGSGFSASHSRPAPFKPLPQRHLLGHLRHHRFNTVTPIEIMARPALCTLLLLLALRCALMQEIDENVQQLLLAAPMAEAQPEILVIGAGISGLAAVQKIKQMRPGRVVWLVEARDRLGGRIDTTPLGGKQRAHVRAHYCLKIIRCCFSPALLWFARALCPRNGRREV